MCLGGPVVAAAGLIAATVVGAAVVVMLSAMLGGHDPRSPFVCLMLIVCVITGRAGRETLSFMPPEARARIPVRELLEDHRMEMAGALLMRIQQPGHVTCQSAALRWVQPFALCQGGLRWRRRRPCRCVSR